MTPLPQAPAALLTAALLALAAACAAPPAGGPEAAGQGAGEQRRAAASPADQKRAVPYDLPGMPPVKNARDIYGETRPTDLAPQVKGFPRRVYVPNTLSGTVSVINPRTYEVVRTIRVGTRPQHVVPSWDMKTLWVGNNRSHTLTPINPATGKRRGRDVKVHDPYNLYFTPDGKHAVVMAPMDRELVFRDPRTMMIDKKVPVPCYGANHADFSPSGRYFIVSCEFSAELLKVDTEKMEVADRRKLPRADAMPQDVKVSPDGRRWFVADAEAGGVWVLDGDRFGAPRLMRTGPGAHGLHIGRDSKVMYISNRDEGTVSVFDFAKNKLTKKWRLPKGGHPDMGGVSADGRVLWLTGRYDGEVYALSTRTGRQLARIPVGKGPHGLAVYPQPGRYSLGHTGVFR